MTGRQSSLFRRVTGLAGWDSGAGHGHLPGHLKSLTREESSHMETSKHETWTNRKLFCRFPVPVLDSEILVLQLFFWFKKKFFLIYLTETTSRQRGKQKRKQAPCRAESPMWGSILGPWDHDLSRMQRLNPLSHPGAPSSFGFLWTSVVSTPTGTWTFLCFLFVCFLFPFGSSSFLWIAATCKQRVL